MKQKIKYLITTAIMLISFQNIYAQRDLEIEKFWDNYSKKQNEIILKNYYLVRDYFEEAYEKYPSLPRGVLEAVSYQYSRFSLTRKNDIEDGEHNMPHYQTFMGYIADGKGVFRENLKFISILSDYTEDDILYNNRIAVLSYAKAFCKLQEKYDIYTDSIEDYKKIFVDLCELPIAENVEQDFTMNSFLYGIYYFLNDSMSICYGIPLRKIDFQKLFGKELMKLRSNVIEIQQHSDTKAVTESSDYANAIFNPAASCNYTSGRNGTTISSITIHYTQGSYAGSIAWFKNCASNVSSHYIIRSIDGQVTQMVRENDKAWHVGIANSYTIGIEHEAMGDIVSYFTQQMYQSSANLVKDICSRRNLNTKRVFYRDTLDDGTVLNYGVHSLGGATACTQIRGHQHYPSQTHTDPGQYWDWNLYYKLINSDPTITVTNEMSGTFTDSGGESGDYGNDERTLFAIHVDGADSIRLNFNNFELEPNYDFLWIYEGSSEFGHKLGRWNTQSPGIVTAKGENMLVEFRSDCASTASGWNAKWQVFKDGNNNNQNGNNEDDDDGDYYEEFEELEDDNDQPLADNSNPQTQINHSVNDWITKNFVASFTDNDDVGLKWQFYQIIESDGMNWSANHIDGFLCDNFDQSLNQTFWVNNYTNPWKIISGVLCQTDSSLNYCGIASRLNGSKHKAYLYDFYLKFNSNGKCSFFFNCNNAPSLTSIFSGYEICFDKTNKKITLYRLILGAKKLLKSINNVSFINNTNYFYRIVFDSESGEILLKRHANTIFKVTDGVLTTTAYSFIGFVTNNSSVSVDNLRVYGSRNSSVLITVGSADSCNMRTQAINGIAMTKLKSIVVDKSYKFSTLVEKLVKVDYTPPTDISGLMVKENQAYSSNHYNVSWNASTDNQSGISNYYYSFLCYPDKYKSNWIANGNILICNNCISVKEKINFSVIAENKAGLRSNPVNYCVAKPTISNYKIEKWNVFTALNGKNLQIKIENGINMDNEYTYEIFDITGKRLCKNLFYNETSVNLNLFSRGIYILRISQEKDIIFSEKIVLTN